MTQINKYFKSIINFIKFVAELSVDVVRFVISQIRNKDNPNKEQCESKKVPWQPHQFRETVMTVCSFVCYFIQEVPRSPTFCSEFLGKPEINKNTENVIFNVSFGKFRERLSKWIVIWIPTFWVCIIPYLIIHFHIVVFFCVGPFPKRVLEWESEWGGQNVLS